MWNYFFFEKHKKNKKNFDSKKVLKHKKRLEM